MNSIGVDEYISYYANKYSGKLFDLNSKTIDNEVLSFIEKEPKLIRKALNNTDDEEDLPTVEPDEKELTKTYILSTNLTTVTLDESLKKNSKVDSDDDGLTDVEELIQSDKLIKWDIDGNVILPTLNEVIRYCGLYAGMKYLPDDILDNKNMRIISEKKFFLLEVIQRDLIQIMTALAILMRY